MDTGKDKKEFNANLTLLDLLFAVKASVRALFDV